MAGRGNPKKPAIPKSQRAKHVLDDVQDYFDDLKKWFGKPLSDDAEQAYRELEKSLIKLVHLDNTQLYHPYVRHYLLSWPKNKDFLRKLHRGLEIGIKRTIKETTLPTLVAICEGQKKGWSLHRTQRNLEAKKLIKPMSRQAFQKMTTRLLSMGGGRGLFYNPSALPQRPKDLPAHVKAAWEQAAKNLQELHTTPERQKGLEEYIEWRRSTQRQKFPPKKPQP